MWLKFYCIFFYFIEGGKFYYFGMIDFFCKFGCRLVCVFSCFFFGFSYGWIFFDGEYFEWGVSGDFYYYGFILMDVDYCKIVCESQLVGYSQLDRVCIEKCVCFYKGRYGVYYFLMNNCYDFVNRILEVLCNYIQCLGWCQQFSRF